MEQWYTSKNLQYCKTLPKVELHAHLNGSVRDETIRHLVEHRRPSTVTVADVDNITSKCQRTLADCFKLFDIIHQCTTDHDSISRITQEVVHDFVLDNVMYLELRTTPKHRPELGMTKASYTQAVLDGINSAIKQLEKEGRWIMVRLLLSIDRRENHEAALETVQLAVKLKDQGIVGIDLSGNPSVGSWQQWSAALQTARDLGLRVTLHAGEVPASQEVADMLNFKPERLGHMCCLDSRLEDMLLTSHIPVELCLTSNIKTSTFSAYPDHHFQGLYTSGHPVVLCTDDSGVFGTTLSHEYAIAMTTFNVSEEAMRKLALDAVEHTFLSETEKDLLRSKMTAELCAS